MDENLDLLLARVECKSVRETLINFLGSGEQIFLKLDVQPHPLNSSHYALWIEPAALTIDTLVLQSFADPSDPLYSLRPGYLEYVEHVMKKFHADSETTDAAKSIIDLEVYLAKSRVDLESTRNWTSCLFIGQVKDLNVSNGTTFNWLDFIQRVTFLSGSKVPITSETPVIVRDMNYIRTVASVIQNVRHASGLVETGEELLGEDERIFTLSTINNYFKFYLVSAYQFLADKSTIADEMRSLAPLRSENYLQDYNATSRCLSLLRTYAPELVGRTFVDSVQVKTSNLNGIENLVNVTRSQFIKVIGESNKLDEKSKRALIDRVEAMKIKYGHPKWIMNDTNLVKWFVFEVSKP